MKKLRVLACLFVVTTLVHSIPATASTWIEDRERVISEALINVTDCLTDSTSTGVSIAWTYYASQTVSQSVEFYQVKVTSGWYFGLGSRVEEIIEGSLRHSTRVVNESVDFGFDKYSCELWVKSQRKAIASLNQD